MGVIRKQDEAISSLQVLALIETGEFCWSREHVDRLIGKVMNSKHHGPCGGRIWGFVERRGGAADVNKRAPALSEGNLEQEFTLITLRGKFRSIEVHSVM